MVIMLYSTKAKAGTETKLNNNNFQFYFEFLLPYVGFPIDANLTFFASGYGKYPCDGIGGTVEILTAHASWLRPCTDKILAVHPSSVILLAGF